MHFTLERLNHFLTDFALCTFYYSQAVCLQNWVTVVKGYLANSVHIDTFSMDYTISGVGLFMFLLKYVSNKVL